MIRACNAVDKLMMLNVLILDKLIASGSKHELFRFIGLCRGVFKLDFVSGASSGCMGLMYIGTFELLYVELVFFVTAVHLI